MSKKATRLNLKKGFFRITVILSLLMGIASLIALTDSWYVLLFVKKYDFIEVFNYYILGISPNYGLKPLIGWLYLEPFFSYKRLIVYLLSFSTGFALVWIVYLFIRYAFIKYLIGGFKG